MKKGNNRTIKANVSGCVFRRDGIFCFLFFLNAATVLQSTVSKSNIQFQVGISQNFLSKKRNEPFRYIENSYIENRKSFLQFWEKVCTLLLAVRFCRVFYL